MPGLGYALVAYLLLTVFPLAIDQMRKALDREDSESFSPRFSLPRWLLAYLLWLLLWLQLTKASICYIS